MASAATSERVEIDLSVYNPFSIDFVNDPFPTFDRMLKEFPVAYHRDIKAWMVSPHDLAQTVLRDPRFSTRFEDWNDAPPKPPEAQWTLYERVQSITLTNVSPAAHQRLRRLTAPAFSRRVMDQIEEKIKDSVAAVFDEIDNPEEFNAVTQIADKVPIRAIARMVGVPPQSEELFEHGLGYNLVRASNPVYSAEDRQRHRDAALPGLEYLSDLIAGRRAAADPGDDFIGTLITTTVDGGHLSDLEILSVIIALVTAGADTAVDLHTMAVKALLDHPEQRQLLRERPELMEPATLEILRWAGIGKFGAIPRFPLEDTELGGQTLEKGSFVMPLLAPAWLDPAKWPDPRRFDITRNHAGNIIFGAGPHLCIGLNLVKVQAKLMIEEFERRFGDRARIVENPEYNPTHFNARRLTQLTIATGQR